MGYPLSTRFEPVRDGAVKTYAKIPDLMEGIAKVALLEYKCAPVSGFGVWMDQNTSFQSVEQIDMVPSPRHARSGSQVICAAMRNGASQILQFQRLDEATRDKLEGDQTMPDKITAAGALCAFRLGLCIARAPGVKIEIAMLLIRHPILQRYSLACDSG